MKRRSRASSLHLSATATTPWWNTGAPRVVCRLYQPGRRGYATVVDEKEPGKTSFLAYPTHANPTAHEIFHLPRAASQSQIKSRYYELVRLHHPDSHHSRAHLSPDQAQSQFASITAAYDYLRGVSSSHLPNAKRYGYEPGQSNFDPYLHELARRRRAQQASQAHRGGGGSGSQDWGSWGGAGFAPPRGSRGGEGFNEAGRKERTVLALGVAALVLGLYPSFVLFPFQMKKTHNSAAKNLAKARNDAREMGGERRDGIRKRVQSMQREKQQGLSELEVGAHGKDVHVSPFEGDVRSA
ncbi:hypothetical protein DFP72DRAFT_822715 [Ephemerocybe angulata]|uniref:J domain-containing protein n=1 Tax=Ephemerocybe angulata TaxID=980116 RepID=A0A8H6LZG6_9AGAR|nr:hypothetical protein DFP72DRAFT_822715 [Tulosesus angulatus]